METSIVATARDTSRGKSGSRKVRATGQVPAVLYGKGQEPTAIQIDPHALSEIFRKSNNRNTVIELDFNKTKLTCLVREVQRHPLSRKIEHVDFFKVDSKSPVRVEVPVTTSGKAKALSSGGRVQIVRRTIDIECSLDAIPASIDIDVSALDVGDYVKVSQIASPTGTKIKFDQDFPVVRAEGKQKELIEAPIAAAVPAEGAAAAAPAAAGDKKAEGGDKKAAAAPEKKDKK